MRIYPDIYLPTGLEEIRKAFPDEPSPPSAPVAPPEPQKIPKAHFLFIAGVLSFVLGAIAQSEIAVLAFALFIIPVALVIRRRINDWVRNTYSAQLAEFRETQLKPYERALERFNQGLGQPEELSRFRLPLLEDYSSAVKPPDGYQGKAKRGKSEFHLFAAMTELLPGKSVQGAFAKIEGYRFPYFPDICYEHHGLYFDVEIDEPYTKRKRSLLAIHGYDEEREHRRNHYFIDRGWVVIRFSEEQVVTNPSGCAKAIAELASEITGEPLSRMWESIKPLKGQCKRSYDEVQ